jgi:hypothetical protein
MWRATRKRRAASAVTLTGWTLAGRVHDNLRSLSWSTESREHLGELRLPTNGMAAGDAVWSGGPEGFDVLIDAPAGSFPVSVVIATDEQGVRAHAVLEVIFDDADVTEWRLVRTRFGKPGYYPEVGLPSFGSPAAYDSRVIHEVADDYFRRAGTAGGTADAGDGGTIVFAHAPYQHPCCRTWLGTAAGKPVAAVTDLGLLGLDLEAEPSLPWR